MTINRPRGGSLKGLWSGYLLVEFLIIPRVYDPNRTQDPLWANTPTVGARRELMRERIPPPFYKWRASRSSVAVP